MGYTHALYWVALKLMFDPSQNGRPAGRGCEWRGVFVCDTEIQVFGLTIRLCGVGVRMGIAKHGLDVKAQLVAHEHVSVTLNLTHWLV